MNACPTPPTPGGSPVPRAKITSTSEQDSADADGIGAPNTPAHTVATAMPITLLTLMCPPASISPGIPNSACLYPACGKNRRVVDHPRLHICAMGTHIRTALVADRIV